MTRRKQINSSGFTIVELIIAALVIAIVGFAIGAVVVNAQSSWNDMYDKMNSDVITDGYIARRKFDSVMRNASSQKYILDGAGQWVEVYYYSSDDSAAVDRYARFYVSDHELNFEYGQLEPRATLDIETVCGNVSTCTFKQVGRSIQMTLTLDNKTQTNTVVSSAVTHNQ